MHKIKNKKILQIILAGLVAMTSTTPYIYANELTTETITLTNNNESNLEEDENIKDEGNNIENDDKEDSNDESDKGEDESILSINLIDITKDENLGKKVKVNVEVIDIEDNILVVKDLTGEAKLFLRDIENKEIKIGAKLIAIGEIENIDNNKYIIINNNANIQVDNSNIEDGNNDKNEDDDKKEDNDKNEGNTNTEDKDENKKPQSNNQSSSQTKPNQSTNSNNQLNEGGNNSNTQNNMTPSVNVVYARKYTTISTDLTSTQWNKVKTALEEGLIKVVDLPNNKIRIKYVSNGYGDKVWIVNDPRGLDEESEEKVKVIGTSLIDSITYTNYDISESAWNTIVEDVENGTAKLKILEDERLKVIYNKNSKVDTTKIIEKK